MFRLSFYPVGGSYLTVVLVALVLLALLAIRPARERTSRRRRAVLVGLRIAVIALVLIATLRPTLVYTEVKKQSATVVMLLDRSRSMSVPDALGGRSRWEALRRSVDDAAPALARLAEDFELKVYSFDAEAHPLEPLQGKISLDETPDGEQTAIGAVLAEVLREQAGKRLLGVVLLSDGAQRALAPRDLPAQTAVGLLRPLGSPLFTFPFGQSRGLGQAQDVAVKELLVNQSVFVKNELAVSGEVRADGYVNRRIPVEVLFETSPGQMEVVAQEDLKFTADGQLLSVRFGYSPQVPGEYKLTLRASKERGELVTTNNELSTFVNVLKGGLNVLYLEGAPPRVEQKFLRRALNASPDISVDYPPVIDPRRPETRPGDLAARFQPGKYEVYILGDLDATAFPREELQQLAEAVKQGAGLIMLGGFHSFGPGGYATTPLADVLPVTMDRFERQELGKPPRADVHLPGPLRMRPTQSGLVHPVLMLAGSQEENLALWSKLPPLEGANRFRVLAPGALVLASAGANAPLLVGHTYGNGRVLAFAGDSTWHWWMHGYEAAHKRFWRQVVLWLARKDQQTDGNVWIRLAKRRFAPGELIEFFVGAQSATGEPLDDVQYEARVTVPNGKSSPLTLVPQDGQMTGSFREGRLPGDYAIEVQASHEGEPLGSARARFLVFSRDLELDNAAADAATLESLAAMTDGGESLPPEQLGDLIQRLTQQTETLEVEEETREPFWDTWPFFLIVVGLLGVEWYLRKQWGLV